MVAVLAATALLGGCASLSEGECRTADWYELGRRDGEDGRPRARFHDHTEACADYGIQPHRAAYFSGREEGLASYCTPRNGYREGRDGNKYREVCPRGAERGFLRAYERGKSIHEVEEKLDTIDNAIERKEYRLDDDDRTPEEREALRDSIEELNREYRRVSRHLIELERRYGDSYHDY
jgi:hypothetical protein